MSQLNFDFVPLTFISDHNEIIRQIRHTIILKHLFQDQFQPVELRSLLESTQYGYIASASASGPNKFLRISDIQDGKVNWDTVPFCDCDDLETYELEKDDILVARTGGTTGKSFKIVSSVPGAVFAGYLIRLRVRKDVNPDFVYLFLNSYAYWSQIVNLNERNFRPKANAENLKSLWVPNCPLEVQNDVVKLAQGEVPIGYEPLSKNIEDAVNQYQKVIKLTSILEEQDQLAIKLQQSILQDAVQGKLTQRFRERKGFEPSIREESGHELLARIRAEKEDLIKAKKLKKEKPLPPVTEDEQSFELPEGWALSTIHDLIISEREDIRTGPFGSALNKSEHQHKGIPVWGIESIGEHGQFLYKNKIFVTEAKAQELAAFFVNKGDIIISRSGTVGELCVLPEDVPPGLISTNLMKISLNKAAINPTFFCLLFQGSDIVLKKLYEMCSGSTRLFLTQKILFSLSFTIPPLPEQHAIVEAVERALAQVAQLREELTRQRETAGELLKALLHRAFQIGDEAKEHEMTTVEETT